MIDRVFVRGDAHGDFTFLDEFCKKEKTTKNDVLIILGDAGINYYLDSRENKRKKYISQHEITLLCIHGNHEERPRNTGLHKRKYHDELQCYYWVEEEFPNILFLESGAMNLKGEPCLICDGAYSVDKEYRILMGYKWFPNEQMSEKERKSIYEIAKSQKRFRYIFSHACPLKYEPTFLFMSGIDDSKIDTSTPKFLQKIYDTIDFSYLKCWYYGHYHGNYEDKKSKTYLLFEDIVQLF